MLLEATVMTTIASEKIKHVYNVFYLNAYGSNRLVLKHVLIKF